MKNLLIIICFLFGLTSHAQWIAKTSCSKKAAIIANEALESRLNVEPLIALGQAKAALILDPDCGCAKIIIAGLASANKNWGSRKEKLANIDRASLSDEEKAWYDILTANEGQVKEKFNAALAAYPNSPMFNYFSVGEDVNASIAFAEKFPEHASAALNSIVYGYGRGENVAADYVKAMESGQKSISLHDGPNIYDTMAEIEFDLGNYKNALDNQLKAVDFAQGGGSPYWVGAQKYWYYNNKEEIVSTLIEMQNKLQVAITEGDQETALSLMDANNPMYTGDSNLEGFYKFDAGKMTDADNVRWSALELYDFHSQFSPDMSTAVLSFYAKGGYSVDGGEEVAYRTRASSVWTRTDEGWKVIHGNWAPQRGMMGIPVAD
jgi:tetratricopeptide (TPR) repeat protein